VKVGVYYYHLLSMASDPHRIRTVEEFTESARRFASTYKQFPAEADHELVVVFLRGHPSDVDRSIWDGIPCRFIHYNPSPEHEWAWAMQHALYDDPCDFMVHFVSRAHFHRPGWLRRVVDERMNHGDGLYGSMAAYGGCPLKTHPEPNPHLRGTMWAWDRETINLFPHRVLTMEDDYRLECGEWNLSLYYEAIGKPSMLVTFDGCYARPDWDKPENTFCNGDQSNLLHWDRHTEAYRLGIPLRP